MSSAEQIQRKEGGGAEDDAENDGRQSGCLKRRNPGLQRAEHSDGQKRRKQNRWSTQKEILQGMGSMQCKQCENYRQTLAGNDGGKIAGSAQIRHCETKKKAQCKTEKVLQSGFCRFAEPVQNTGQCGAKAEKRTEQCTLANTGSSQRAGKQDDTD